MKEISSIQNKQVKRIRQLQEKARSRKKEGVFVVEGLREIQLALSSDYEPEQFFIAQDIVSDSMVKKLPPLVPISALTARVYQKVAYRGKTEGALGIFKRKNHSLQRLDLPENPLILVAEGLEKPGNIGALLRTADGAGIDAFILANPKTDLYNPNTVRSSVGCLFSNSIGVGTTEETIAFLNGHNISIYAAALQDSRPYTTQNFTRGAAIIVGTESQGLSHEWRRASCQNVLVPMRGKIDSLNVSVSAGILIYEVVRQRSKLDQ